MADHLRGSSSWYLSARILLKTAWIVSESHRELENTDSSLSASPLEHIATSCTGGMSELTDEVSDTHTAGVRGAVLYLLNHTLICSIPTPTHFSSFESLIREQGA